MARPVQSFRVDPEHRELLNHVIQALEAGRAPDIRAALDGSQSVGPFRDAEAALGFLRDRLVATLAPDSIYLFGSRARGDAAPDADFDLLVVLPDGRAPEAYSYAAVAEPLVACGLAYDVVPCSRSELDHAEPEGDDVVAVAKREGRRIYAARALRRADGAAA